MKKIQVFEGGAMVVDTRQGRHKIEIEGALLGEYSDTATNRERYLNIPKIKKTKKIGEKDIGNKIEV